MTDLSILRNAGVIETLLYLAKFYPNGRRKIEIRTELCLSPSTAVKAQRLLFEAGLMQGVSFSNANTLTLTAEGKKLADSLKNAQSALVDAAERDEVKGRYMKWNIRNDTYNANKKDFDEKETCKENPPGKKKK